ncbi:MAG: dihydroorotate dehydrogenase electron transfer subunit [Candidatus Thermoplasmatota archaeon]
MNYPYITTIKKTEDEAKDIKTILFKFPEKINPGQFFMIWIPGIDEIPMSVSYIKKKQVKGITFKKVGEATQALYNLKKGDKIGIRGPYGNGFDFQGKKILFVGGGTGIAMLAPAVEKTIEKNKDCTIIIGAKNQKEIFFEKRLQKTKANTILCTDDGSCGNKGFATDQAFKILSKQNFSSILTCGPEIMMKKLYNKCKNVNFQASLERYMKCAVGICGQCCIGKGIRVCKEGPILTGEQLKKIEDFGKYKRNAAGQKIPL